MNLKSSHQDDYINRGCQPSKLNEQLASDLRNHHAKLGIGKTDWNTTYRKEHFWKQPNKESYD